MNFYLDYLAKFPDMCTIEETADNELIGIGIGKVEGEINKQHGHVSVLSVAPDYRCNGYAIKFMNNMENISENQYESYFIDLFVKTSNIPAVNMYKRMGYVIYRHILEYYGGKDDAYDMRKSHKMDKDKKFMICLEKPVNASDIELTL